jgi:hypothetical protein
MDFAVRILCKRFCCKISIKSNKSAGYHAKQKLTCVINRIKRVRFYLGNKIKLSFSSQIVSLVHQPSAVAPY